MSVSSLTKPAASAETRWWVTDSLHEAGFDPPPSWIDDRGSLVFLSNDPATLWLPLADAGRPTDPAYWRLCSFGALPRDAAEWAQGFFDALVRYDRCDMRARYVQLLAGDASSTQGVLNGRQRKRVSEVDKGLAAASKHLRCVFERGLEARMGTRLSEPETLAFVQGAARLLPPNPPLPLDTRWRVCERCDLVYAPAKKKQRLCPNCKGQRIPRLRPWSSFRYCDVCSVPFEPGDLRQSTCETCRSPAAKTRRSRNPNDLVRPETPHWRDRVLLDTGEPVRLGRPIDG
jgi:hypothetical protein